MADWAEGARIRSLLGRISRRRRWLAVARGAAGGLGMMLVGGLAVTATATALPSLPSIGAIAGALFPGGDPSHPPIWPFLPIAGAALGIAWTLFRLRRAPPPAALVEQAVPDSRNVVLTASELLDRPGGVRPYIASAVCGEAVRVLSRVRPARVLPAARPLLGVAVAMAGWGLALAIAGSRPDDLPAGVPAASAATTAIAIAGLTVEVIPPAYATAPTETLDDPERIFALVGSTLRLTVGLGGTAEGGSVVLETVDGRQELEASGPGSALTGEVPVTGDGFLSIEPRGSDGGVGPLRLIGLTATADLPPFVHVEEPGRDIRLSEGDASLDIAVEATDDHGLASLALHYTKVTGFGEQFTFLEGEVPLEITRDDDQRWRGQTRWSLAPLELERGDIVVYRAVATDRRPGSSPGESETYIVEITDGSPGTSGGYAGEDDLDRYALSQQMVIVLTERLMARRDSLGTEDFESEAQTLAAAQRQVRAGFVFMLGGELDDGDHEEDGVMHLHEEAHARADADVLEGRMASEGRQELVRAIQAMSHAAILLVEADLEAALQAEETALVYLQRAFSRSRYILRAFTERESLDPSRRLSGSTSSAASHARSRRETSPAPRVAELREALSEAAALSAAVAAASEATVSAPGAAPPRDASTEELSGRAASLAQSLLRVDAASDDLREAAALLSAASATLHAARSDPDAAAAAREPLDRAALRIAAAVRGELARAPEAPTLFEAARLDGALADALSDAPDRPGGGER